MDPSEITVVVFQAHGLSTKKKNKHKYNVTFGVNNNRAKSENVDQAEGNPEWNTEAEIKVDNPLDPLVLKVKDKDDILGQITLHMHELPTSKPTRPKTIPLQPHKKAPNPQGELLFSAWISAYGESKSINKTKATPSPNGLAAQHARMLPGRINGSHESLDSTISGFSTMSESTKKRSTLKKLKGVFKKSPMLGGSNLASKNSSQSCVDLSAGQSNLLAVQNINLNGSRESLTSQVSEASNLSALSGSAKKKSKNPFKKLKEKTMGSKINKNNSQSMHNLAFGSSGMTLSTGGLHGSSESLDKLKTSSMDKNFPNKFDLTVPKTLISSPSLGEGDGGGKKMGEIDETAELASITQVKGHRRIDSDTSSIHSTGSNQIVTPEPMQKRRLSYQARSLRDDPRERPHPSKISPQPSPVSTPLSQRQASSRSASESSPLASKDEGHHRSLCLPKDEPVVHKRSPTMGSSKEDVRASKNSLNSKEKTMDRNGKAAESSSEDSFKLSNPDDTSSVLQATLQSTSTPKSSTSLTHSPDQTLNTNLTTKTPPQDAATSNLPEITGVSPSESSIEGGTVITLRGQNLGQDKADVVWLSICGANCLRSLEYISAHKLRVTTKSWKPGQGKIAVETQSGGRSQSLVNFTFVDNSALEEPEEVPMPSPVASPKQIKSKPPPTPVKAKSSFFVEATDVSAKDNERSHHDTQSPRKGEEEVKDPRKQKREDPEGMPMAKQENGDSGEKFSSLSKVQSRVTTSPPKVKERKSQEVEKESAAPVTEGPSQDQLLEMVKRLQGENQALKDDNTHMKGYIDRIINRVIDRCPDVLCVDMSTKA